MRILQDFDPIAAGEADWRAFDFTKDCGGDAPVSTAWTCALMAGELGTDDSPQAHIGAASVQASITELQGPQNTPVTRTGVFSVCLLSGVPASAVGSYYMLTAELTTTSGRVLSLQARILCVAG